MNYRVWGLGNKSILNGQEESHQFHFLLLAAYQLLSFWALYVSEEGLLDVQEVLAACSVSMPSPLERRQLVCCIYILGTQAFPFESVVIVLISQVQKDC